MHLEADRIPNSILSLLKNEYGSDLKIVKKRKTKREESIISDTSDWFKNIKAITKPSDNLKIYRTNLRLSQGKLAKIIVCNTKLKSGKFCFFLYLN